ncbi:MAG: hypothetical protein U0350_28540 [Caldilineaceae bacterium]
MTTQYAFRKCVYRWGLLPSLALTVEAAGLVLQRYAQQAAVFTGQVQG